MEHKAKNKFQNALALILFTLIFNGLATDVNAKPDPEILKTAIESQPSCSNFIRYDDDSIFLGFGQYKKGFEEPRQPIPGYLVVAPITNKNQPQTLATSDSAIDVIREGNSLFVLTYSSIEEWDLATESLQAQHATYAINGPLAYFQHAQAFARWGDKVIIAHGRLGVSFFDLKKRRVVNQFPLVRYQLPLESIATGVAVVGKFAYVAMTSFHLVPTGKQPFRGVIVIDMEKERVVSELDGMDPGADSAVSDGAKLIVSFGGNPIWKYAVNDLKGSQIPEPEQRIWRFPVNGHPVGHASVDEKYYYTCFEKAPAKPGGYRYHVPLALDRRLLMLD